MELIASQVTRIVTTTKDLQLPITFEMNPLKSKKTPRRSKARYRGPELISDIPSDDEGDPFEDKDTDGDSQVQEEATEREDSVPEEMVRLLNDAIEVLHKFQDKIESIVGIQGWSKLFDDAAVVQRKFIWSVKKLKKADLGEEIFGHLERLCINEQESQRSLEMK